MNLPFRPILPRIARMAGILALALAGAQASAQLPPPPAVLPLDAEPPARLQLHAPVPAALARGVVILQFRTENFRVFPLFGKGALGVSPRVGHLHVTVGGTQHTWAHTSGDPIIVVGLKPGAHEILVELADPNHGIVAAEKARFTVPDTGAGLPPAPAASAPAHRH